MSIYLNDPTATIFLLGERLRERGYEDKAVKYGGVTYHLFTKNDRTWITNGFKISYPFNSKAITEIAVDKAIAYDFALQQGVSVPVTVNVLPNDEELTEAKKLLERFGKIIVKPLDASLAIGVTLNIKNRADLEQAVQSARHYSGIVLAQQQVHGDELRFAVVNGKAVAALLRQTARVVGDGKRTIAQLIEAENKERLTLPNKYFEYPQLDGSLIDPELITSRRILKDGKVLELSHSAMVRYGASMYNVLKDVDQGYIDIVEKLGSALSRDFIVVDIMIADYGAACTPDNYWFIEFNTSPVLKLFHGTRDGNDVDIVGLVAERIDSSIQAS
jgi:cyanophycin synthetase